MSSKPLIGIVKQVISGDTIVIRDKPIDKSPNEITIRLSRVKAPKLGRKTKDRETKDEPYAWEAREFLRKKLVGQEVKFIPIPIKANEDIKHEIGKVYFPKDDENHDIARELVANGLARVDSKSNNPKTPEDVKKLFELEDKAKAEKKGQWNKENLDKHIRNIKYVKDYTKFLSENGNKPLQAIVEQVRNDRNAYMILDVMILPNFYSIPFALSGLNFNDSDENYREESKFFVECRLLQQDGVRIVVEKALKSYVLGTVLHPRGSIAELLLQEGFAFCDDNTLPMTSEERMKLRNAEKSAKEKKLRIWKTKVIIPGSKKKEFQGTVTEVIGGDAMMVKLNSGESKKIFLASIRPPREARREPGEEKTQKARTLFDVPWLYEAREFLRTKLVGKKVNVTVDFEQPPKDDENGRSLPEKLLCTVLVGGVNIAEQLVQNGLATVITGNRQGEDKTRSSHLDALVIAENKAKENHVGLHSKGEPPKHKVSDCVGNRAQGLFPLLQKASRIDAIVEYVMSGSKMRLFIPKDSFMITFLLSGISCPRAGSLSSNKTGIKLQADPFGDEALNFTKEKILQRKVEIRIEALDKFGNMIGSLFIGNTNLALALVEEGLAFVHQTCSDRTFMQAEKVAKANKLNVWQNYEEDAKKDTNEDDVKERTFNYKDIVVTVVAPDLHIYAHHVEEKKAYTEIGDKLRQEFSANAPACCSRDKPPVKGKLYAAKYTDNEWYRGKVEKTFMSTGKALVNYVDYGNREVVLFENLAPLPDSCVGPKPFAHEYGLACVQLPPDHYKEDVVQELIRELADRNLRINVEYHEHNLSYVSITDPETSEDCIKTCIAKGLFYAQKRREKKLHSLIDEYLEAQNEAQKKRLLIWEYGDARDDDAKEFGLGK